MSAPSVEIEIALPYQPFPKQQEFHRSKAKYRLFGGAAGPGKSKALLMEGVMQALEHDGVDTLLLRRTFPELETSLLNQFRRDIPRDLYKSWNESKHVVTWHNGSTTRFGYCESENDVYQYQGGEFLFIGIDELTLFTLRQWQFLTSRNRCPIPGAFPCMAGATNPGNIGHAWVKALWIDREPAPGMESASEYDSSDYEFISARVSDNPVYASDVEYLKTLNSLPLTMRRAFLDGSWDIFAGQYFTNFRADKHVIRAESLDMQDWWTKWVSIDWGFEHKAVAHWHTKQPAIDTPTHQQPERTVTYREMTFWHTGPTELARHIVDASPEMGKFGPQNVYLGPDAWAKRTDEQSIAEQIGDVFSRAGWRRPEQADNDRVGGWMLMYQLLDRGEWVMADNCTMLIKSLPTLVRDESHVEDIEKVDGDDAADCARYGLKSRHRIGEKPLEMRVQERIEGFQKSKEERGHQRTADPTAIAMMSQKALMDERKKSRPVPVFRPRYAKFGTWRTR